MALMSLGLRARLPDSTSSKLTVAALHADLKASSRASGMTMPPIKNACPSAGDAQSAYQNHPWREGNAEILEGPCSHGIMVMRGAAQDFPLPLTVGDIDGGGHPTNRDRSASQP